MDINHLTIALFYMYIQIHVGEGVGEGLEIEVAVNVESAILLNKKHSFQHVKIYY